MVSIMRGPEGTGLIELVNKLKVADNYFTLIFKGWKENERGETYADIEIVIQGFRDGDEDGADMDALADFLQQIGRTI